MQKLRIKEKVSEIVTDLNSVKISESVFNLTSSDIDFTKCLTERDRLIQYIIASKSKFDNLKIKDVDMMRISDSIDSDIYSTVSVALIISIIFKADFDNKNSILTNKRIFDLYLFHKSLINFNKLTAETIQETQRNERAIIFTLVSSRNPQLSQIVETLQKLQELIDIFEKIYEEDQENMIYLLDKGSDTNIGIETGIKTVKSLFQIFKEVWDWMVNRKYYKQKLRNAAFLENLDVLKKLSDMQKSGAITREEFSKYKELIIKKTDELLSLNTVPRQILLDREGQKEDNLLLDYNEVRLLNSGNKSDR